MNDISGKPAMGRLARAGILFIAQGAYTGRSPVAPGTAGTLLGVLVYAVASGLSLVSYLLLCVVLVLLGIWAAGRAETLLGGKDDPRIVIDEVAGYLVAMILIPSGWAFAVAGFFLFRFFDIVKPFPLDRLQRLKGGLGVMIDDLGAAVYTNIVLRIISWSVNG
jgi:phosphatidylglycerophosphatase A